jgi:hypothetical protein
VPSKAEGIARIEANTGLPHNPVETILGEPTVKDKNSESYRLWQDHQEQTAARVGKFKAGAPHPGMAQKDPRGLRFLPAFIMAVAMAAGGVDGAGNMSQPFDWTRPPPAVIPARVDAWVTPPEYTRAAPVFLTVNSEVRAETPNGSELVAPTGSRMVIRVAGGDSTVTVTGGIVIEKEPPPLPPETDVTQQGQTTPDGRPARPILREYELLITDDATVSIQAYGGVNLSWSFDIAPDSAPQVSVQAAPNTERPNLIDLQYGAQDDHGVVNIETVIGNGEPPKSKSERPPRPLIEAPVINLPVPR